MKQKPKWLAKKLLEHAKKKRIDKAMPQEERLKLMYGKQK